MKMPVDEIQRMVFVEYPTKQSSHQQLHQFDIIYDFSMQGGFDHKRYCILLLRALFALKKKERISFLDYQCKLVTKPFRWLNSLYLLLENNFRVLIRGSKAKSFSELIDLIEEKRNLYPQYPMESNQLDDYQDNNAFTKRYRWRGTVNQLVHMYYQTLLKTHKGNTLLDLTTQEMIDMIMERYCRIDGTLFNPGTIRSYLKPSKSDKHPNMGQQIIIPEEETEFLIDEPKNRPIKKFP
jgi:hypothetical protein